MSDSEAPGDVIGGVTVRSFAIPERLTQRGLG